MKKFLLLSAVLGLSVPAFAQMNNTGVLGADTSLMAEIPSPSSDTFNVGGDMSDTTLRGNLTQEKQPIFDVDPFGGAPLALKQVQNKKEDNVARPTANVQPISGRGLFPELGDAQPQQKQQGSESIKLIIDDVSIVQPAFNGMAFCMGTMTLENNLNIRIQQLDVVLNYGGLDVPLSFSDISPLGGTKTEKIAWATDYCNSMLDVPEVTVKTCVASTLTKAQCQSKLQYKPIESK